MKSMKQLQKIFVSGLITFLPIAVTIYIVYAGVNIFENVLGNLMRRILPSSVYFTGFGFLTTMILIFLLGLMLNNWVTAGLLRRLQEKLTEVPFIKVVYSPLRDLMNLFSKGHHQNALKNVVFVKLADGVQILGLVTRDQFTDLAADITISPEKVAVYVPMSYGLGGYTLLIDKSQIETVNLPVEKAMSLALTGWIKTDQQQK